MNWAFKGKVGKVFKDYVFSPAAGFESTQEGEVEQPLFVNKERDI